jgi:outer membrane receptor protein involved in Fe transport
MQRLALLWITAVFLLPPGYSRAADVTAPGEEELFDEFAFLEMEATVETAARRAQPISLSPSAITLLIREDIEATGARVLPEVLRDVPGMDVNLLNPFWYELGVRGGQHVVGTDNVMLLVDGRDLTVEFFGFPMWTMQHFSLDDIKRIEVVRGPGSALYGANAYGGVVQIFTYEPGEGPEARVSVHGGEHGQMEVNGRWSRRFGSVALAGSVGVVREDLWTGRDQSGRDAVRGRLDSRVDLGKDTHLSIEAGAFQTSGNVRISVSELEIKDVVNFYTRARLQMGDLAFHLTYDRTSLEVDFGVDFIFEGIEMARVSDADGTIDKIGMLAQHFLEFFHNRFTYGAEYIFDLYHISIYWDPDQFEHRLGVFLQDEVNLGEMVRGLGDADIGSLVLTAGLRFDSFYIKDWGFVDWELSPRAALVWAPARNHSLRFGYAHAFLKPKFFEARLDLRLNDVLGGFDRFNIANPDLDNETIDSLEAGYSGSFLSGRLVLRLDFSYSWYRDGVYFYIDEEDLEYIQIGSVRIPRFDGPGFGTRNNPESYEGHTLELQASARPVDAVRMFVNVAYRQMFNINSRGRRRFLRELPIWRLAAGGDVEILSGWKASLRAYYTTKRYDYVRGRGNIFEDKHRDWVSDYFLLNVRLSRGLAAQPFEISAGVEVFNLLGTPFRSRAGIYNPNLPDYIAERAGRRIVLFLEGRI